VKALLQDPMLWFLLAGIAVGQIPWAVKNYASFFKLLEKHGLAWTIALLGLRIGPDQLLHPYLAVVVGVFVAFWVLSRRLAPWFGLKAEAGCLVSFGTTICGATAVATAAPLLQKKSNLSGGEVGAAVATVNFLGALGIVLVPLLANLMNFSPAQGGILAGGTLHAVGQGALGIECRLGDDTVLAQIKALEHLPTARRCLAERAFLRQLEGGCQVPIGVNSRFEGEELILTGMVASLDGLRLVRDEVRGAQEDPEAIGVALALALRAQGAGEILEEIIASVRPQA
jgi:hypothetical protein